jgi:hypothetical protein
MISGDYKAENVWLMWQNSSQVKEYRNRFKKYKCQ